ncbi:MAG: hypothetical protein K0S33_1393 [Bacteroidetes bacterium]|nr:hypothetical protein [Bacteroidota bacterium]
MRSFIPAKAACISIFSILLFCCTTHTKKASVLYTKENTVEVRVKSSCRLSTMLPLDTVVLKEKVLQYSNESIKKFKLKTGKSLEKASYRISKTQLIITERCGAQTSTGQPFMGLAQVLILEHIPSGQLLQFSSDTIIVNQAALNQPATLVPKKVQLEPYINGLMINNYIQLKNHFKSK